MVLIGGVMVVGSAFADEVGKGDGADDVFNTVAVFL